MTDSKPQASPESHRSNEDKRTLILTGASRGIGHATVKRFSSAGWRVITCSRHAFPEDCPWAAGPEDHIQVDLADPDDTCAPSPRCASGWPAASSMRLVNNAGISPEGRGRRAHGRAGHADGGLAPGL